jgi:hypothetical protein
MPNVKMKLTLSGTCNGVPWPEAGALVNVDEDEAVRLVVSGQAVEPDGDEDGDVVDLTAKPKKVERTAPPKRETREAKAAVAV